MHALELLRSHVRVVFLTAAYNHTAKTTFSTLLSLSFQQHQMAYDEGSQTEAEADLTPKARCDRSNATRGPSQVLACLASSGELLLQIPWHLVSCEELIHNGCHVHSVCQAI